MNLFELNTNREDLLLIEEKSPDIRIGRESPISVIPSVTPLTDVWYFAAPKTAKSGRTVPVPEKLFAELKAQKKKRTSLLSFSFFILKYTPERPGHASIALTPDVYSHVIPDMQHYATEKIGAPFIRLKGKFSISPTFRTQKGKGQLLKLP